MTEQPDDFLEALMTGVGADPVESWLTDVRSPPPGSTTPSSSSMLPPASPLAPAPLTAGTSAFPLSPRPTTTTGASHRAFPSPSAARRGCFGPRHNGVAYPLPRSRADDAIGDRERARRRRALERGSQSVPTHLMQDLQVPPIQLPGTLHGMGHAAASTSVMGAAASPLQIQMQAQAMARAGGGLYKQEPMPEHPIFGSSLLGRVAPTGDTSSATAASDWEDVTRQPLVLDSDERKFEVPAEYAKKIRAVRDIEERLTLLDELEKKGKEFVEEMKKERSEAYYARMHAIPNLSAPTKVTIRGRIHSKLNPFVKEQSVKVNREIFVWLLKQIPFE